MAATDPENAMSMSVPVAVATPYNPMEDDGSAPQVDVPIAKLAQPLPNRNANDTWNGPTSYEDECDFEDYDGAQELSFASQNLRLGFVRKTMGILFSQLAITFGIIAIFTLYDPVRNYVHDNAWVYYISLVVSFTALIALICCGNNARIYPQNYLLLFTFTAAEGTMLGVISSHFDTDSVLMATGMTLVITFGLMLFACQTKIDFTGWGAYIYAALLCLLVFGILSCLFYAGGMVRILYALAGCIIFSMYIVYDTQLMIGGKHKKYQYTLDDYVFASLSLYLDIINLFLMILSLFGRRD